jgi:tetratricopeptide (TPR) repeat protein
VLGITYGETSRNREARAAFERALSIDPHDLTANLWMGVTLINTGYTASGSAATDRVLAVDPLMPNALLWRGIRYYYAGDLERAELMLRRAADVGPSHSGVGMRAQRPLRMIDTYLATKPLFVSGVAPYSLLLLGEQRRALAVAAQRRTTNDVVYLHVLWAPTAREARSTPEFQAMLNASNSPPCGAATGRQICVGCKPAACTRATDRCARSQTIMRLLTGMAPSGREADIARTNELARCDGSIFSRR